MCEGPQCPANFQHCAKERERDMFQFSMHLLTKTDNMTALIELAFKS